MTYSLTAEEIAPTWYALVVTRGREEAARQILERDRGVSYAFYPDFVSSWTVRGKHYKRRRAEVPGLVYARFIHRPMWHVIRERELLHGVLTVGGFPYSFSPTIIKHLQGLTVDAEALREARRQARLIRVGDKARFSDGPLGDFAVDVTQVDGNVIRFLWPNGLAGETDVDNLIKAAE